MQRRYPRLVVLGRREYVRLVTLPGVRAHERQVRGEWPKGRNAQGNLHPAHLKQQRVRRAHKFLELLRNGRAARRGVLGPGGAVPLKLL